MQYFYETLAKEAAAKGTIFHDQDIEKIMNISWAEPGLKALLKSESRSQSEQDSIDNLRRCFKFQNKGIHMIVASTYSFRRRCVLDCIVMDHSVGERKEVHPARSLGYLHEWHGFLCGSAEESL